MAANNLEEGRNLGMEVDEMKEMMIEIAKSQRRMEEMLLVLRETINLIGATGSTGVTGAHPHLPTITSIKTNPVITTEIPVVGRTSDTASLVLPIGERCRFSEDTRNEVHGNVGFTREQPPYNLNLHFPYQTSTPTFPSYPSHQFVPTTNNTPQFQTKNGPVPSPYVPTRSSHIRYPPVPPQNYPNLQQPQTNFRNRGRFHPQNLPPFPRLSMSNSDLFQRLFDAHLMSGSPVRPLEPPFPAWYNPSLTCKYHMDIPGHSIEDCESFKIAVRKLIAYGKFDIQEIARPSVVNSPILDEVKTWEMEGSPIGKVRSWHVPMAEVVEGLKRVGCSGTAPAATMKEKEKQDEESSCAYHHGGMGHDAENYWDFKVRIQELLASRVIQAGQDVDSSEGANVEEIVRSITLREENDAAFEGDIPSTSQDNHL